MQIDRRHLLVSGAAIFAAMAPWRDVRAEAGGLRERMGQVGSFEGLEALAREVAKTSFEPPARVPKRFVQLSHDQYQAIRLAEGGKFWSETDLPFRVAPFHNGWIFPHPIDLFEIGAEGTLPIPFEQKRFTYPDSTTPPDEGEENQLGYAGIRVFDRFDFDRDIAAFLGASYFRAVGKEMQYGLSARGLALNTMRFGEEEFPIFRAFWLERPAPNSSEVTVLALLDSASTTGAYRFVIQGGRSTVMDVTASIFPRTALDGIGLAPITSMYLHGENDYRARDDFRPEVHDSDGLVMRTGGGEWIWRPLRNPSKPRISTFSDTAPRGFGLQQRDRSFAHYLDDGVYYDRRPNLWIEPTGDWGQGRVELVELPAGDETVDNIVVYWRPATPPQPDQPISVGYRMYWGTEMPDRLPAPGRVMATWTGIGGVPGQDRDPAVRKFVVDFTGGDLDRLREGDDVEAIVTSSEGAILEAAVRPIEELGGWRMNFDLDPEGAAPIDLRAWLRFRGGALTETWLYTWHPDDV
ncbi:MAG: glucan biosynthesis protein [Thalassobaculaceae bacterium]|nr:glucan biosynthesis protein [Thalassobaculaceae bacterium]